MELLIFSAGAIFGGGLGMAWKLREFRELQDKYARLTDRDSRGRFVKRER